MKLMIASDLHGSVFYTEKLLERFGQEEADRLLLLGDLYYHGPRNPLPEAYRPKNVAALLGEIKDRLTVTRGNCDSEVDLEISPFPFADAASFDFGSSRLLALHGQRLDENVPPRGYEWVAYGHLHTAFMREKGGVIFLNPGSVSLPKDGKHAYIVTGGASAVLKNLTDGSIFGEVRL